MFHFPSASDASARIYNVDLNATNPVELARRLHRTGSQERACLLIDCHNLRCLRTRGVSFLASQLLATRAAGADIVLYNVGPLLYRTLRLLGLHKLFTIWKAPLTRVSHGAMLA